MSRTYVQQRFCLETRAEPCGVVVFGASGDLAERKLFPSLYELCTGGQLPKEFYVLGTGRTEFTDEAFRDNVAKALQGQAKRKVDAAPLKDFLSHFSYHTLRYDNAADYQGLAAKAEALDRRFRAQGNRLFYLSVPPQLYGEVVKGLGATRMAEGAGKNWRRIIVEKPFGHDLESSRALTDTLKGVFAEDQVYRIDHYLGKETVQNILVLRFANIFFEPVWNRNYVDHVQITVAETLGVGHRAGYYDRAGAVRDMFQNHLLQLLCVTAMEAPASFHADRVRDEKAKVMAAVRPFLVKDLDALAVRGRYGAGKSGGTDAVAYLQEKGVPADSRAETFAAFKMFVDNWRWQGVPFYLRSGKRLPARATEIIVQFKHVPHLLFAPLQPADLPANRLILRIQPEEGLSLSIEGKHPGPKMCLSDVTMDFSYEKVFGEPPEAYERLFLDAMAGDQTLFTRSDWVDQSWALLDPLLQAWAKGGEPAPYAAGSWGPAEAEALMARDGRSWVNPA